MNHAAKGEKIPLLNLFFLSSPTLGSPFCILNILKHYFRMYSNIEKRSFYVVIARETQCKVHITFIAFALPSEADTGSCRPISHSCNYRILGFALSSLRYKLMSQRVKTFIFSTLGA